MSISNSLPGAGGGAVPAAHLITMQGPKVMAHVHGMQHPVEASHPSAHVTISKKTMFEHAASGKGKGKIVPLHKTYHTDPTSLPPALVKMIADAIANKMQTHNLHAGMTPPKAKAAARKEEAAENEPKPTSRAAAMVEKLEEAMEPPPRKMSGLPGAM